MRLTIIWHGAVVRAGRLWIEDLAERPGMDVTVVSPSVWSAAMPRRTLFEADHIDSFKAYILKPILAFHGATFVLRGLRRALCESNPDVVLGIEEPFSLVMLQTLRVVKRLKRRPKLICHSYQNIVKQYPFPFSWIEKKVLAGVDAMTGSNPEVLQVLERKGYRGPSTIFPQAIDLDTWKPNKMEGRTGTRSEIHIGFVGRFVPEKGIDTLLECCRRLEVPYSLTLVGDGPLSESIRREVSEMNAKCSIVNGLQPLGIAKIYPSFDVLVVPSKTRSNWKEQFGRVLIEAMACGVPVIGSDSGSIPWVIGDAGIVFHEGDSEALAREIEGLAGSVERRRRLGELGRERVVKEFSSKVVVDRLMDFVSTVMG